MKEHHFIIISSSLHNDKFTLSSLRSELNPSLFSHYQDYRGVCFCVASQFPSVLAEFGKKLEPTVQFSTPSSLSGSKPSVFCLRSHSRLPKSLLVFLLLVTAPAAPPPRIQVPEGRSSGRMLTHFTAAYSSPGPVCPESQWSLRFSKDFTLMFLFYPALLAGIPSSSDVVFLESQILLP